MKRVLELGQIVAVLSLDGLRIERGENLFSFTIFLYSHKWYPYFQFGRGDAEIC